MDILVRHTCVVGKIIHVLRLHVDFNVMSSPRLCLSFNCSVAPNPRKLYAALRGF